MIKAIISWIVDSIKLYYQFEKELIKIKKLTEKNDLISFSYFYALSKIFLPPLQLNRVNITSRVSHCIPLVISCREGERANNLSLTTLFCTYIFHFGLVIVTYQKIQKHSNYILK